MTKKRLLPALFILCFLLFGLFGCSSKTTSPDSKDKGTSTEQKDKKSDDTKDSDAAGEKLVNERCTVCHDLGRVEAANYDRAGWESAVDRMIARGAKLNPEDRQQVIDYLSNR